MVEAPVMAPSQFHHHIWKKILQEPSTKYKSNLQTMKSKQQVMPNYTRVLHEYYKIKHLSHFDDLLTAEIPDSADLIKVLNVSKTTRAFISSSEVSIVVRIYSTTEKGVF